MVIGSADADATSYVDDSAVVGSTYTYAVEAVNSGGTSAPSNTYQVTLPSVSGLVGLWPMDEGVGGVVDDLSGNGDNGTITGEVTWEPGKVGAADLNFHGAGVAVGDVDIPDNSVMDFTATQSFSLGAWVNPNTLPSKWAGIITKSTTDSPGYGLYLDPSNDWVFATSSSDANPLVGTAATTGWHYLTLVQDGVAGTRDLYVDGVLVATGTAQAANGTGDLWFGGSQSTNTQFFNGSIDDVRLYNRVLTPAEIAAFAQVSTGGDTTPPAALLTAQPLTSPGDVTYQFNVAYTDNVAVDASTINNNDILVTGPHGYSEVATLVSTGLTDGPTVVATYSIPAPSVTWDGTSNGTYTVTIQSGAVTDTSGNAVPAGTIGTITVNIATLGSMINGLVYNDLNASGVRDGGEPGLANWTVYLVDTDDDTPDPTLTSVPAGDPSTTTDANGDFLFTGVQHNTYAVVALAVPGWTYTQPASGFLTVNANTGGNSDVLQFGEHQTNPSTALPNGWTDSDVGTVGVAGSGSYSNGVFSIAGAGAQVGSTADGFNFAYQSVTGDGSITARVTSSSSATASAGIMMRSSLTAGSTNVYLSEESGQVVMTSRTPDDTATVSAGTASASLPVWLRLVRTGNSVQGYYSTDDVTFSLLGTVSLALSTTAYLGLAVCANNLSALDTSTFDNVTLSGTGAVGPDTTPPTAAYTTPPAITVAGGTSNTFTITYSDNVAIDTSTITKHNITVTGPNGPVSVTQAQVNDDTDGPVRSVIYTVVPPDGAWSVADDGTYTVNLTSEVTDTDGNPVAGNADFGTFVVNIPATGTLRRSAATAAASYNLTALGTADWAHWGRAGAYSNFDHDATGGSQISNVNTVGAGSYGGYAYSGRSVNWTNGTPTATDTGDDGYIGPTMPPAPASLSSSPPAPPAERSTSTSAATTPAEPSPPRSPTARLLRSTSPSPAPAISPTWPRSPLPPTPPAKPSPSPTPRPPTSVSSAAASISSPRGSPVRPSRPSPRPSPPSRSRNPSPPAPMSPSLPPPPERPPPPSNGNTAPMAAPASPPSPANLHHSDHQLNHSFRIHLRI